MRFMIANDAVNTQGNNVGISVDDLRRLLDRYRGTVESAMGIWFGLGSTAFRNFDAQFQPVSNQMIQALQTMQAELEAANTAYTEDENAQQAAIETLNGGLGFTPPRI